MDRLLFAHFLLNKVAGTRRENHGNLHYRTKMKIEQSILQYFSYALSKI